MFKRIKDSHLFALLCAAALSVSVYLIGLQSNLQLSQFFQVEREGAVGCESGYFSFNPPSGYTFQSGCITDGSTIYANDNRFTFFKHATSYLPQINYIKTPNVPLKNLTSLDWTVTTNTRANVYVFYRRAKNSPAVPSWLNSSTFRKNSGNTYTTSNFTDFLLRKNGAGLTGVYDTYQMVIPLNGTYHFREAGAAGINPLSMYIVALERIDTPVPTPTPTPTPTRAPTPSPTSSGDVVYGIIPLDPQNNSGQSGTATIYRSGTTQTRIVLQLQGGSFSNQPAHIHSGTCDAPGAIIYALNTVVNGRSETYINVSADIIGQSLGIINVHKSAAESNIYTACGPQPDGPPPTPTPSPITGAGNLITSGVVFNTDTSANISRSRSTSVRVPENLINPSQGWIAGRMRMGFANNTTLAPDPIIYDMSQSDPRDHFIYYDVDTDTFHFARNQSDGGNTVSSPAQSFATGALKTVIVTWSPTQIGISIDGGAFTLRSNNSIPNQASFYIGSTAVQGSGRQPNSDYLWVAAGTGFLTNANAQTINGFGNTDKSRTDFPGNATFIWDAASNQYNNR